MSKDRLMCKQCANTDMEKMNFTNDGKYLSCHVCGSNTPLYDAYFVYKEDVSEKLTNAINLAHHLLESGELEKAAEKFREALSISSESHAAWWGLYVCEYSFAEYYGFKDKYNNSGPIIKAYILSDLIEKYGKKAVDTAPDEIAAIYNNVLSKDEEYIRNAIGTGSAGKTGKNSGCYIATAVYGGVDEPEVVFLRSFRDQVLSMTFAGRLFIKLYYKISPSLSKYIRQSSPIAKSIRSLLDRFIRSQSSKNL